MTQSRPFQAMVLFAVVLSLSLAAEIILQIGANDGASEEPAIRSRRLNDSVSDPGRYGADLATWAATILDRPLFRVDRKPVVSADDDDAAAAGALPRLSGIVGVGSNRLAVFKPESGGHLLFLREGGQIGRWTVDAIGAGRVRLKGPEGTKDLFPHSDRNLPGTTDNPSTESAQSLPAAPPPVPRSTAP